MSPLAELGLGLLALWLVEQAILLPLRVARWYYTAKAWYWHRRLRRVS